MPVTCDMSVLHEEPSQERVAISDTASRTLGRDDHHPGRKGSFRYSLENRGAAASITAGRVEAEDPEATRENREVTPVSQVEAVLPPWRAAGMGFLKPSSSSRSRPINRGMGVYLPNCIGAK